ncbi:SIR2 family protein [Mycobacterium sp. CBMA 234]|nr:SIR2 family protein [Mycolicibacterium sp. CBMA 234]
MGGHLFIINGDLTKVACDALLIPTDSEHKIELHWLGFLESRGYNKPGSWVLGDVFLSASDTTPHIWLGNIGQPANSSGFKAFAPTVRAFVDQAKAQLAAINDDHRIRAWPRKRLAVNVVGSGAGGGVGMKGNLTLGLVQTLSELATTHDVDIVLVTWGEKAYAAAQRARRQVIRTDETAAWKFHARSNPELFRQAHALADEARKSQLVLFIGAGVSAGVGLPTWARLLREAAEKARFDSAQIPLLAKQDLRDQATLIDRRMRAVAGGPIDGRSQFKADIAEKLSATQPYSLAHGLLASLPGKEAVTTNFDVLFEQACKIADADIAVLPENPHATEGRWLLKLHGGVNDPERMVLTRSDYLEMPRRYGALMGLVQGLLMLRKMVFIGYSLSDEDFHELVDEVRAARAGATEIVRGTVLSLADDPLHKQLWDTDLDVVPMIIGKFSKDDPTETALAARELDLFLDLVGYLSTTSASFFLDDTYSDLAAGEEQLRDSLITLRASLQNCEPGPVAGLVDEFLKGLGATSV